MENGSRDASEIRLQIQLFGAFEVQVDGVPIAPLRSRKVQWLLALLVLRHDQALDRAWLAGTLWPESAPSQSLYNLRQSLSNLRHVLGEGCLRLHAPTVSALSLEITNATVDVTIFDEAVAAGDVCSLERATTLYRGVLLEGCNEEWVLLERRVREESYLSALERLADNALLQGDGSAAVKYLQLAVQVDPFRERTQRALLQALASLGEYGLAVQAYRELRLLLRRELNTDPDPETIALAEHIRNEARLRTPVRAVVSDAPLPVSKRQLPFALSALVGRKAEVEQIVSILRAARLLTLTGPGGVGKTRLAIAAAEQMAGEYSDGVCFVDLAPLTEPTLIAQAVAAALQVREQPGRTLPATLQDFLGSRKLLLLLDNCEHLLDGCARLTDALLKHCPEVSILATSRQILGLTGEIKWTVPPLTAPNLTNRTYKIKTEQKEWLSLLSEYEAVKLFVVRVQQALPTFQMSARNAEAVAQICARLDGMPLALELAAARARSLSMEDINSRLDRRFHLLTGGSRTALPRQQTLRALIDWSYDLLNDSEKAMLCRLAVFAGGWTLRAAEEVCTDERPGEGEALEAWEALDLLTSLADKSLILMEQEAGETRYRLLETMRQYAHDRLGETGETGTWCRKHRDYFLRVAEEAEANLGGTEQAQWLQRLEADHDNLRAALDFCLTAPDGVEIGLQLAGTLQQFWWTHGHLREGRDRLEAALNRPEAHKTTPARARAAIGAGSLAWMQGDYAAASALYNTSLAMGRELGDKAVIAGVLGNLGSVNMLQGDYAAARAHLEESLALKREAGDRRGIANSLIGLGNLAIEQGDFVAARALGEESLALGRELNDERSMARSLVNLGNVAVYQGDHTAARSFYEGSLEIQRELGDTRGIARSLNNLGNVAMEQKDYVTARYQFEKSLELQRELGDKEGVSNSLCNLGLLFTKQGEYSAARSYLNECLSLCRALGQKLVAAYALEGHAELAQRQQQAERSVRLYGTAHALREIIGSPLPAGVHQEQEQRLTVLRDTLGAELYLATWAEGQALTLEQAMEHVGSETSDADFSPSLQSPSAFRK